VIIGDVEEVLTRLYLQKNHPNQELIHNEEVMQRFRIENTENVSRDAFRDFAGKSILVVEDNDVNQKVLASILEAADIQVHKAENGRQALALLNQGVQIDLILMDMNMPVMDGFEATRKIKDEPLFRKIPVIAVSGLGFYHELERMQFVGVDACIIKPFKLGQLYEGLKRYLGINTLPETSVHVSPHRYEPPEQILNVKRGIRNVHNEIFYREILQDVRETLDHSDKYVSDLIYKGRIDELQAFCRDSLSLVDTVGAKQVAKIFKEILVFISVGERKSLVEYVPLYKRAWKLLDREIARYLGSATKE
jgi:CheY-like chemotaxis protein